jgi:hypothetical protein
VGIDPRILQVGQTVTVKELNFGVLITPTKDGETGPTVVELGPDHLTLEEADGGRRQIPLYLINKSAPAPVEAIEAA